MPFSPGREASQAEGNCQVKRKCGSTLVNGQVFTSITLKIEDWSGLVGRLTSKKLFFTLKPQNTSREVMLVHVVLG